MNTNGQTETIQAQDSNDGVAVEPCFVVGIGASAGELDAIDQLFRRAHEIEFSVYKDAAVLRRIHRRVALVGAASLDQYAEQLADDSQELNSLYSDLLFDYALKKNGIMMLGGSESPGELASEFAVLNERSRIYRKRCDIRLPSDFRTPMDRSLGLELHTLPVRTTTPSQHSSSEQQTLHEQLLNRLMPPSLLIDDNRSLADCFGGAEKFLRLRSRKPSLDVLDLMDESIRTTLSGAIGRTLKDNSPVRFSNVTLRVDGIDQTYNLTVTPVNHPSISGKHHVISFEAMGVRAEDSAIDTEEFPGELDASRAQIRQLEIDLRYSRGNLQSTIEELETSNEELQATNEELIASNKELQSTNENLHNVNEELYTVNAEHQRKNTELAELNQDMNLLLENTDVATVFLDKELRVRRFTSRARRVFDFVEHDVGRFISSFSPKFAVDDLVQRLGQVVRKGEPQECETLSHDGTCYLLRMLPYRIDDIVEGVVLMLVDVSSLEVLRERLRWMSAIVESTDDAIIGQNLAGVITSWNAGAERLYGYTAKEAVGQHVSIIIPKDRRSEVTEYHESIKAGERLHTRDTIRIRKDSTELNVSLTVSPVFDAHSQLIGISKIARDVSERIALQDQIRTQVSQREAFLATLSHELRNPLSAAMSASRLIVDERTDTTTRHEAAQVVGRQITLARGLLSDLLDLSRVTQGKVKLHCEPVDLCSLVAMVCETTLSEAKSHHQEITWDMPDQPLYVDGDATRLTQVQVNLIHNSLKYSPEHSEVRVSLSRQDDRAVIAVTDYGVGIPEDQLDSIFDPFVQIGETVHQSEGGLGVGLTLVRCLVEAHRGQVDVKSNGAGKGTTFRVSLPITELPIAELPIAELSIAELPRPPHEVKLDPSERIDQQALWTIVLIEDIDDSRKMLASLLSMDGHIVHSFRDGESGVEAIAQHHPDFALIDIGLPGIDGYEVARRTRQNSAYDTTKLIALTGFGQQSDVDAAINVGFDEHLVKPVDLDALTMLVNEFKR